MQTARHVLVLAVSVMVLAVTARADPAAPAVQPTSVAATPLAAAHVSLAPQSSDANRWHQPMRSKTRPKPCARTQHATALVAKACKDGGQARAVAVMRRWLKKANRTAKFKVTCKSCHTKVGGAYPLNKGGLKLYRSLGGK